MTFIGKSMLLTAAIVSLIVCQIQQWSPVGGPAGANILAYTTAPNGAILAGTRDDGIYRSADNGVSWIHANTGILHNSIWSLHTAPNGTIYAGAVTYGAFSPGSTLYRSTNNGESWTSSPDIQSNDAVYAITSTSKGILFAGTADLSTPKGIYRSTDNGGHWEPMNNGITNKAIITMIVTPGDTVFAGAGGALFRSTNNGVVWTSAMNGIPSSTTCWSFAVDSMHAILVGTTDGAYRSSNGGTSWALSNTGLPSSFVRSMVVLPSGTIIAGTNGSGNYRSTDNGASWNPAQTGLTDLNTQAFCSLSGGSIVCGTPAGNFKSSNNGVSWEKENSGLTSVSVRALHRHTSGVLIAGTTNSLFVSNDDGKSWNVGAGLPSVSYSSLTESGTGILFAGTVTGYIYRSVDTGKTWVSANPGWPAVGISGLALNAQGTLFAASSGLFRTTDNGATWTSSNLPGFSYITSLAVAKNGDVYVSTNSIGILRSTDNGNSWISATGDFPYSGASNVMIDLLNTLYASSVGAVFSSSDNGIRWTKLSSGLPNSSIGPMLVNSVGQLFVSTADSGLFSSKNRGKTWKSLKSDAATASAYSIVSDPKNHLLIGTKHGVYRSVQPASFVTLINDGSQFGLVQYGESAIDSVVIENNGIEPLVIDSVWSNDPNFFSGSHPNSIAVGDRQRFVVGFSPRRFGYIEGKIYISSNAHSSPDELIISGTGKAAGFYSPDSNMSYGRIPVNTTIDTTVRIINIGNDTMRISSVMSSDARFTIRSFPSIVAPGETLTAAIRFQPYTTGLHTSNIVVTSSAFTTHDTIHCSAIAAGIPTISFSTKRLQFGTALMNSWKDTVIVRTNTGTDTLNVFFAHFSDPQWRLRTFNPPLPPGSSAADTIRFTPSAVGTMNGYVILYHNAAHARDTIILIARGDTIVGPGGGFVPEWFDLSPNFPNPFNSGTRFRLSVPATTVVTVTVFNSLGQEVESPVSRVLETGIHTIEWNPKTLSSGLYLFHVHSGHFRTMRKIVLVK